MRWRTVVSAAVVAAVLLGAAASCGVPAEDEANRVDPASVPFGLLEDATTTTVADAGTEATIYLAARDRLVAVDRTVADDASLADLLEQVVAGPTEVERTLGITSAVPAGTVASVGQARGTARVDLTEAFGDVRSDEQFLALGQLVYTLTGQPGIGGVEFTLEGEPVSVPLPDGTATAQPVSRDDFSTVAPR
ncbi:MAG: GerMN domain-containing protein [Acidimicrobiales bacterium]|nr:GerMN domain-containing protein [Acidimicrobiales bacterium]